MREAERLWVTGLEPLLVAEADPVRLADKLRLGDRLLLADLDTVIDLEGVSERDSVRLGDLERLEVLVGLREWLFVRLGDREWDLDRVRVAATGPGPLGHRGLVHTQSCLGLATKGQVSQASPKPSLSVSFCVGLGTNWQLSLEAMAGTPRADARLRSILCRTWADGSSTPSPSSSASHASPLPSPSTSD